MSHTSLQDRLNIVFRLAQNLAADTWRLLTAIEDIGYRQTEPTANASPIRSNMSNSDEPPASGFSGRQRIGAGDLCDVYLAKRNAESLVLKESRPCSRAAALLLRHEASVLRELTRFGGEQRTCFPRVVDISEYGKPWLALEYDGKRVSAAQLRSRYPHGIAAPEAAWIFQRTLRALGTAHRAGWLNGAVLPPHLLVGDGGRDVQVSGWLHAVRPGERVRLVPAKYAAWYPRECRWRASTASDIYLAAKSAIYLFGGDAAQENIPDRAPEPLRLFLKSCLLPNEKMRPRDALELAEDLEDLLIKLYGAL